MAQEPQRPHEFRTRRFPLDGQLEFGPDQRGDLLERDALFRNGVVCGAGGALLEREAEQDGGVVAVDGGPAGGTRVDVDGGAGLAVRVYERGDEPCVPGAVHRGGEADHGAADSLLFGQGVDEICRLGPVGEGGASLRFRVLGREASFYDGQGARGDDERFPRAGEHLAHGGDGGAVRRAGAGEVTEVVDKGQMDDTVRGGGAPF